MLLKCKSFYQRGVCIFSMHDLPLLITRYELFANKLNLQKDPIAYQCIDKWLNDKSKNQNSLIPVNMYCTHPIVKYFNNSTNCQ